jgi:hypothetical protein
MHDRASEAQSASGAIVRACGACASLRCSLKLGAQDSGHGHDIARCHCPFEVLIDAPAPAIHRLPNAANGFAPTEVPFDALANQLAHRVTRMARGARVDGAAAAARLIARHMRRHRARPACGNEVGSSYDYPHSVAVRPDGGIVVAR